MKTQAMFEIEIGATSNAVKVTCNGVDITSALRAIRIDAAAGEFTSAHLTVLGTQALVKVKGVLNVGLEVPTAEATPLGSDYEIKTVLP